MADDGSNGVGGEGGGYGAGGETSYGDTGGYGENTDPGILVSPDADYKNPDPGISVSPDVGGWNPGQDVRLLPEIGLWNPGDSRNLDADNWVKTLPNITKVQFTEDKLKDLFGPMNDWTPLNRDISKGYMRYCEDRDNLEVDREMAAYGLGPDPVASSKAASPAATIGTGSQDAAQNAPIEKAVATAGGSPSNGQQLLASATQETVPSKPQIEGDANQPANPSPAPGQPPTTPTDTGSAGMGQSYNEQFKHFMAQNATLEDAKGRAQNATGKVPVQVPTTFWEKVISRVLRATSPCTRRD